MSFLASLLTKDMVSKSVNRRLFLIQTEQASSVMFTARVVSSSWQITINQATVKADLHGTIFAYDCRMRFL